MEDELKDLGIRTQEGDDCPTGAVPLPSSRRPDRTGAGSRPCQCVAGLVP